MRTHIKRQRKLETKGAYKTEKNKREKKVIAEIFMCAAATGVFSSSPSFGFVKILFHSMLGAVCVCVHFFLTLFSATPNISYHLI